MVKLYYSPTYCGAASFIAAFAAGVNVECEQVDLTSHQTASGTNFYDVNPKGNVPCLVFHDGTVLNEGAAVLQWIADQNPGSIASEYGSMDRYLTMNALNYIASEVHTTFCPLFGTLSEENKAAQIDKLNKKFAFLQNYMIKGQYLVGDKLSIADFYLYIVLGWADFLHIETSAFPAIKTYWEGIDRLQVVKEAHKKMATNPNAM